MSVLTSSQNVYKRRKYNLQNIFFESLNIIGKILRVKDSISSLHRAMEYKKMSAMKNCINKDNYKKTKFIEISDHDYKVMESRISVLMANGEDLTSDQVEEMQVLASLMQRYDDACLANVSENNVDVSPHIILKELMDIKGLQQKDLVQFFGGYKSNTSAVLNGKRKINNKQAKELAKYFHVSPALFI